MSGVPGGGNHGRRRGAGGEWRDLDPAFDETQELGLTYIVFTETHGLRSTYKAGCRCDACRRAEREYRAGLRNRSRP